MTIHLQAKNVMVTFHRTLKTVLSVYPLFLIMNTTRAVTGAMWVLGLVLIDRTLFCERMLTADQVETIGHIRGTPRAYSATYGHAETLRAEAYHRAWLPWS